MQPRSKDQPPRAALLLQPIKQGAAYSVGNHTHTMCHLPLIAWIVRQVLISYAALITPKTSHTPRPDTPAGTGCCNARWLYLPESTHL